MSGSKRTAGTAEGRSVVKAVLLISAVIMAAFAIIGGIYLISVGTGQSGSDVSAPEPPKYFYELLPEVSGEQITPENMDITDMSLEEAFALYSTSPSYYQEATVVLEDAKGNRLERVKLVLRDGERYSVRTFDKGVLIETVKCDGEKIRIINEITGESSLIDAGGQAMEELTGLPSHAYVQALIAEKNENADGAQLDKVTYSLLRARGQNMLQLGLGFGDGMSEKYFYYLDEGVIYHCESTVSVAGKRTTVYSMTTTGFETDIRDRITEDSFSTAE
ncbi:MAG: hypothetical protein E7671_06235 [Ruminococcaceae bacterium]|nr:hypothetical protein [Oscillospiraceae bacterium]